MSAPQRESTTRDALLDGRVLLVQPAKGYRVAIDSILLAAAIAPPAWQRVLDVGAGTGAVSLCLASRCPDADITGLELDAALHALSLESASLNDLAIRFICGDLFDLPSEMRDQGFDHVVSNPPYWEAGRGRPSSTGRQGAHFLEGVTLLDWVRTSLGLLAPNGTFTTILPSDRAEEVLALLMEAQLGVIACPIWPREGAEAKRVIIQARAGAPAGAKTCEGLVLHGEGQSFTPQAQAILRDGAPLLID